MDGLGNIECKIPNERCTASHYFDHSSQIEIEASQISFLDDFVRPLNGVNSSGPFEFSLDVQSTNFLQMRNIELEIQFQVFNGENTKLVDADNVAVINNFANAFWKQIEVTLNSNAFHGNTALNSGFKSYIENVLSLEKNALETHCKSYGLYMDDVGQFDTCGNQNSGFQKRKELIAKSRVCDFYTSICTDFLRSDNFLVPGNKLTIRLTRQSDAFVLMSDKQNADYRVKVVDLKLYFRRSQLAPQYSSSIIGKDERYISKKTEVILHPLSAGLVTKSLNLVTGSVMPKSVVIAMNSTEACEGSYALNPWNFQNFGLSEIWLKCNGKSYPSNPLRPSFSSNNFSREYSWLYGEVGCLMPDRGLCISPEGFKENFCFFPFDMSFDRCNQSHR